MYFIFLTESCEISVAMQELRSHDKDRHVAYCEWLLNMVAEGYVDPFHFFSTDEAWFHLSGYVNMQNK